MGDGSAVVTVVVPAIVPAPVVKHPAVTKPASVPAVHSANPATPAQHLAFTGAPIVALLLLAAMLLAFGGLLLTAARRRRS